MHSRAPQEEALAEARLGRIASAAISSSMLLFAGFLALVGASFAALWWLAVLAAALIGLSLAQAYFLSTIAQHGPARRLKTWQYSLLAHALVFAGVYGIARDPVVFAVLIPELLSAALHLPGLHCAAKALQRA